MLEFALVVPLLVLAMLLFFDLGRIVYVYTALNNAVREGARFAVVHYQDPLSGVLWDQGIRDRVVGYALAFSVPSGNVSVDCDLDHNHTYPCHDAVTVSAHVEIAPMLAVVARFMGGSGTFKIAAQSTMQMTPYGSQ